MIQIDKQDRMQSGGAVLECFLVPWDSEIFDFPVAQIDRIEFGEGANDDVVLREFETWCDDRDVRLVSCRLEHTRLRESMALEALGFRFVEMVYSPKFDALASVVAPRRAVQVTEAVLGDLGRIEEVAYSVFTTGRYYLDWRLEPELSKRRYSYWVKSSFDNPRHSVLKAQLDGDLVGFFIVERRPDGSAYWHLTAIAPRWQGQGLGASVWQTMLMRHRDEHATFVETTISAHNTAVINLYARLGFSFQPARMTFHWLRDAER